MKLLYESEVIGEILTNRNLTLEECFEILDIDIDEYDYELFEMVY